jgi:hypothetical protein
MKIGITCYPTYGGSGAVATELGLALARRGHEVHFITYAYPSGFGAGPSGSSFHEVTRRPGTTRSSSTTSHPGAASKQHEVARSNSTCSAHYAIPTRRSYLAGRRDGTRRFRRSPRPRHRHHPGRAGAGSSHYLFSIEQSDIVTAVSTFLGRDHPRLRNQAGDLGHSEFRQPRGVPVGSPAAATAGAGRHMSGARLQLPRGQGARRGPIRAGAPCDAGHAAADRRRPERADAGRSRTAGRKGRAVPRRLDLGSICCRPPICSCSLHRSSRSGWPPWKRWPAGHRSWRRGWGASRK